MLSLSLIIILSQFKHSYFLFLQKSFLVLQSNFYFVYRTNSFFLPLGFWSYDYFVS